MEVPARRYDRFELVTAEGFLVIRTPYERVRVEQAKKIPHCRFRPELGGWAAPPSSFREVFKWCRDYGCPIPPAILELGNHIRPEDGAAPLPLVELSVYQGIDGPSVTTVLPGGTILTKTFASWPAAARYVTATQAKYEDHEVRFITAPL